MPAGPSTRSLYREHSVFVSSDDQESVRAVSFKTLGTLEIETEIVAYQFGASATRLHSRMHLVLSSSETSAENHAACGDRNSCLAACI